MKRIIYGIGRFLGTAGRATVALIGICGVTAVLANYAVTLGSGTNFGSVVVSSVHYAQQFICDLTTPAQCASVSAAGAIKVDGSAATQPVSGTVTANLGTIAGTATAANQATEIASLASIVTNTGAAIPAGSATIGNVNGAPNVTLTDCSGTVTTGGTAVNAFTAQSTLHGFTIVNLDTTEPMWISFTGTAAASTVGSYPVAAPTATTFAGGGSFTSPFGMGLNTALSVVAATTGHKFSCSRW